MGTVGGELVTSVSDQRTVMLLVRLRALWFTECETDELQRAGQSPLMRIMRFDLS